MTKTFAHNLNENGAVQYIGLVIKETDNTIRLEAIDPISMWAGMWVLTGCLYDLPKKSCRLFNDEQACMEAAMEINNRKYGRPFDAVVRVETKGDTDD